MSFFENLFNRDNSQIKRGKRLIPVNAAQIADLSHESYKTFQLEAEMFDAFPNSLVELLAWPARNLVKLYDQSPEKFDVLKKSKVPVRFYLEKDSFGWSKHLQMPSHASYILRNPVSMSGNPETDISYPVGWEISGAVEDAIRKINKKSLDVFRTRCK